MRNVKTQRAYDLSRIAWLGGAACLLFGSVAWAEESAPSALSAAPSASVATTASAQAANTSLEPPPDTAATQFVQTCSGCHTIGGGVMRGPDLAGAASWPELQLTPAVKSMERKVGPLAPQQVELLVKLLKDNTRQDRLAKARAKLSQLSETPSSSADSSLGGALFFGQLGLKNGGMACSSCHRFHGEGGELGPDLSQFAKNAELEALAGTIVRAGFPVMRGAYQAHPITAEEGRNLAAFLQQSKSRRHVAPFARTTATGFGVGVGAFLLTLVLIMSRPRSVRTRLIQRATKR